MKIIYAKSKWEMWHAPLTEFLERTKNSGFDATELYMPLITENPKEIIEQHKEHGLEIVAQIITEGDTPDEHLESLE
jgi:sugar phosphate isomerase/epimerase